MAFQLSFFYLLIKKHGFHYWLSHFFTSQSQQLWLKFVISIETYIVFNPSGKSAEASLTLNLACHHVAAKTYLSSRASEYGFKIISQYL